MAWSRMLKIGEGKLGNGRLGPGGSDARAAEVSRGEACVGMLRDRAISLWRAGGVALSQPDKQQIHLLESRYGPLWHDVLRIVENFAAGAREFARAAVRPDAEATAEFVGHLDMLLNGLDHNRLDASGRGQGDSAPPHMIQSELWQVLHRIRESAELSYSRELNLVELDRRILFLLQSRGPLVPAEISSAVGVDKAQVSRSVKRLLQLAIVRREQLRAPLHLTGEGEVLGKRLARLAELRNRELAFDIGDEEMGAFLSTVQILLDRAVALYERERALVQGEPELDPEHPDKAAQRRMPEGAVLDRTRIVSPLLTLNAYFNRSGALAFKRLTGLSTFEAFVMSEVGRNPPIEWPDLVAALQRDHSQAGRTVNALMERELIERTGGPGRRHGRFAPTPAGAAMYEIIYKAGQERSVFLLAPLGPEQRARFLATFDKLRRNAVAQLEREQAFAELEVAAPRR